MFEFIVGALLALMGGYFYMIAKTNDVKEEYDQSRRSYDDEKKDSQNKIAEWYGILDDVRKSQSTRPKNLTPKERIEEWLKRIK